MNDVAPIYVAFSVFVAVTVGDVAVGNIAMDAVA